MSKRQRLRSYCAMCGSWNSSRFPHARRPRPLRMLRQHASAHQGRVYCVASTTDTAAFWQRLAGRVQTSVQRRAPFGRRRHVGCLAGPRGPIGYRAEAATFRNDQRANSWRIAGPRRSARRCGMYRAQTSAKRCIVDDDELKVRTGCEHADMKP